MMPMPPLFSKSQDGKRSSSFPAADGGHVAKKRVRSTAPRRDGSSNFSTNTFVDRVSSGPNQHTADEDKTTNSQKNQIDDVVSNDDKETAENDVPAPPWNNKRKEPDEKLAYQAPLPRQAGQLRRSHQARLFDAPTANVSSRPSFMRMPLHMAFLWMVSLREDGLANSGLQPSSTLRTQSITDASRLSKCKRRLRRSTCKQSRLSGFVFWAFGA